MRIDRFRRVLAILGLLALGLLVSYLFPRPDTGHLSFGEWIWLTRRADLIIQPALMFVGALGIRCLLPSEHDSDESHE